MDFPVTPEDFFKDCPLVSPEVPDRFTFFVFEDVGRDFSRAFPGEDVAEELSPDVIWDAFGDKGSAALRFAFSKKKIRSRMDTGLFPQSRAHFPVLTNGSLQPRRYIARVPKYTILAEDKHTTRTRESGHES